jgi:hypothetical protein
MSRAELEWVDAAHLQDGDILLYPDDEAFNPHQVMAGDKAPDLFHAEIYMDGSILHSTASMSLDRGRSGVKKHRFDPNEVIIPILTLRCRLPDVRAAMLQCATVFALTPEEKKEQRLARYLTLYASPSDRGRHDPAHEGACAMAYAFLRAMRTQAKAARGDKQSLSRHKGLACSQFVLYTLQAGAYQKVMAQVMALLSGESQAFVQMCEQVVLHRLATGDAMKLKTIFASHQEAMAQLDAELKALMGKVPGLDLLSVNPKGIDIFRLYEALRVQESVELRLTVPVVNEAGALELLSLSMGQARTLPEEWFLEGEWPMPASEIAERLTHHAGKPVGFSA